ncbi:hypothetical protein SAMD00019534_089160 [Acytostelium subglobosum LB1]|uniref:hypothetical protein n=1 Tax=Acytostelium subglobosum LB1 TaxID=1410327 RepID=UPI000644F3AF|nr:hypothetical protein SAMD00019534_089160 [Acytostelium subglobosum LB1]GAM25741.1 hypothetical protein SAMD00019534_089160 [Acytostelium subglobosum LB1]|eukprot:XP_012751259.1 hypothetical protein SAMD00019534_089160 [Acytostelium subglobosum LB1]
MRNAKTKNNTYGKLVIILLTACVVSLLFMFHLNTSCDVQSQQQQQQQRVDIDKSLETGAGANQQHTQLASTPNNNNNDIVVPGINSMKQPTPKSSDHPDGPLVASDAFQTFLTFLYYHTEYTNVTPTSPSKHQYGEYVRTITLPEPGFEHPAVMEVDKIKALIDKVPEKDKDRNNSLNFLERRRLESDVVREFYEFEGRMFSLERAREELKLYNTMPFFETPIQPRLPKPMMSGPYLFLHVPKTGGNSVLHLFRLTFAKKAVQQWVHPGHNEKHLIRGAKAVVGHFNYGLHTYLDQPDRDTANYMTMLRDPVERVISHYYYHREKIQDEGHALAMKLKFEEWLEQSPRGANEQTRVLSGMSTEAEKNVSMESFRMALYHLRKMKFVGITEKFKESIVMMKYYCGLGAMKEVKINNRKKKQPDVPADVIELIKKKNWMDIYLYEEALKMFDRQTEIIGEQRIKDEINNPTLWRR